MKEEPLTQLLLIYITATEINATDLDMENVEISNIKARDGTESATIANSTGVMTIDSSVLTTTDINGGTIDGVTIATSDITVGTDKTLDVSQGTLILRTIKSVEIKLKEELLMRLQLMLSHQQLAILRMLIQQLLTR